MLILGMVSSMAHSPTGRTPAELGISDETAFIAVGSSGTQFIVTMQRPSATVVLIKFAGLRQLQQQDMATVDALLVRALSQAFSIEAIAEVSLSGDGDAARVFAGIAPLDDSGLSTVCQVSRDRFESLLR